MSNCLIGQSGGPTAVINASLAGVIQAAIKNNSIQKVYGAVNGIEGVLNNNIIRLDEEFNNEYNIKLLTQTPSAYLGSCRFKLPEYKDNLDIYDMIFNIFIKYDIEYFFYIGGNDSMDTVKKLSAYAKSVNYKINIIGVPKTIDNDLVSTDHTPGFGSAAKYIATCVKEITRDSNIYNLDYVVIIEIMGRNAGWLTAASALARTNDEYSPDLIYLPEVPFDIDNFIKDVKKVKENKKTAIVCISEGIKDNTGKYISESKSGNLADGFGHKILGGTVWVLEDIIKEKLNCKVRAIEINVLQRAASHCTSLTDISEAIQIGGEAVKVATEGITGCMMSYKREDVEQYKIEIKAVDINNIANKEKAVPIEWINKEGNDITPDFINYLRPLILGEPEIIMEDGLPKFIVRK